VLLLIVTIRQWIVFLLIVTIRQWIVFLLIVTIRQWIVFLNSNYIIITFLEVPHVTPVHEPTLSGASEKITKEDVERRLEAKADELRSQTELSEEEVETKMKEEKMRIALEKMKLASKRKEVIKVFNNDGSNKTVVVEDGMTAAVVCYLLVTKNHFEESPNWVLIERLGDVGLGTF